MADKNTRDGAVQSGDDALVDPSTGDAHSAFLDDEELNEQLPDEFDADDRTALTAAHQGSDPHGGAADTADGQTSLFAEDPIDPAFIQADAGALSAVSQIDGLPVSDALFGETSFNGDANDNPADPLSAPSLLNDQTPEDVNTDDQSALVAAHQGAQATALPLDQVTAFNPGEQADLFGDLSATANAAAGSAGQSSSDALSGSPGADLLGELGLDVNNGDGSSAPGAGESGGRSAAATAADGAGAAAGDGAVDGLQLNGDGDPGNSGVAAVSGNANESSPFDVAPLADFGSGRGSGDDGLGGSGDQGTQPGSGGGRDDVQEYIAGDTTSTDSGVTGGGGGGGSGGVNPIIGDKFDNNLTGTDGRDMINAKDGNDIAFGGAGDDLIMGKKGDDTLQGGLGDDTLKGGHGDDTFVFTNDDFNTTPWTDVVDGQGQNGNPASDYDTIDLTGVAQGWTLEVDGAGAGAEAQSGTGPASYTDGGAEFSGTITFGDGSTITFDHIEKIDW